MLTKVFPQPHRPDGFAKRLSALVVFAIALGVAVLTKSSTDSAEHVFAKAPRAFYVSYVDDANDDRNRKNYGRLKEALVKMNHGGSRRLSVEFVQVVVGEQPSIDDVLHRLVNEQPVAIIATSDDVLQAAKAATTSVPILFMSYADPVTAGEVKSIAVPGVNRTGFTFYVPMIAKAIELLIDAYPGTKHIGILIDSITAREPDHWQEVEQARREFGVAVDVFVADNARELESVLRQTGTPPVDAWYVPLGTALWYEQPSVIAIMAATRKPVLYDHVAFVRDGGLMAYEARIDAFSTWANQLLMIAHGTDVASIPVERPSRFDLAINLDKLRADPQLRPTKQVLRRANVLIGAPDHDI